MASSFVESPGPFVIWKIEDFPHYRNEMNRNPSPGIDSLIGYSAMSVIGSIPE